jgi:hypothetical protein
MKVKIEAEEAVDDEEEEEADVEEKVEVAAHGKNRDGEEMLTGRYARRRARQYRLRRGNHSGDLFADL